MQTAEVLRDKCYSVAFEEFKMERMNKMNNINNLIFEQFFIYK